MMQAPQLLSSSLMRRTLVGAGLFFVAIGAITGSGAAAATSACRTHELGIRPVINGGAAGTRLIALSYRNLSRSSCTVTGYPGVTLYGPRDQKIVVAKRARPLPVRTLILRPGDRVYDGLSYGETPVPENEKCSAVIGLRIIAPNSRQSVRVAVHDAGQFCADARVGPPTTHARKSLPV
jgi:hypothetical protein